MTINLHRKYAQWAETNEKSILRFLQFLFYEFIEKLTNFDYKNDHISKIKNRNDRKIDYSFVLAHCASFINFWPFLRGEGCLHILTWDRAKLVFILKIISTFAKNNCIQSFFSSSITRADQKYVISLRNVQHRKSLHNNTLKHLMTVQRTRQEMGQRTPQITPKTDWTNHSDQAHSFRETGVARQS